MTDTPRTKPEADATQETKSYEAPTLVRYGTLFVTVNACSQPGSTGDLKKGVPSTDICDADDGPIDGPKK